MRSVEDRFLAVLARGGVVSQDEYDQMCESLPPEVIAQALARRFDQTGETSTLVEAARLYARAGLDYEVMELCSRSPRVRELQRLVENTLPRLRQDYPGIPMIGKLLEEAFLVIDLNSGKTIRFPPLMPATFSGETNWSKG